MGENNILSKSTRRDNDKVKAFLNLRRLVARRIRISVLWVYIKIILLMKLQLTYSFYSIKFLIYSVEYLA